MNLLERVIKLANDLDQGGFFEEASQLDEIVREAADGVFGPGTGGLAGLPTPSLEGGMQRYQARNANNRVKAWQKQYNTALDLLKTQLGFVPPGLNTLVVDGIKGKETAAAMDRVKQTLGGKGTISDFVNKMVALNDGLDDPFDSMAKPGPALTREPRGGQIGTYIPVPTDVIPSQPYPTVK